MGLTVGQHVAIDECSSHSWVGPFRHCIGAAWDGAVHCHAGWASIRKTALSSSQLLLVRLTGLS